MINEFEEWLNINIPKSAKNYITGYKTLNNLSNELTLPLLDSWNKENYDENATNLKNQEKFITLNTNGNNMYSATLSNFKKFLQSKIVVPPSLPFPEFTWRWASKGPTEGINKKEVLFGVLKYLVKYNGKLHATQDFYNDMESLEKKLDSTIDLKRNVSKNIIENSGQYWKSLGLIKTTTDGTINVTDFGLKIINDGISNEEFIKWQIDNFILPNIEAEKNSIIELYKTNNIEIKPLKLLIEVLYAISRFTKDKFSWYISVEELRNIIIPLSINKNIPISTYVEHLFKYREDSSKYIKWPKFEDRMIREYLLFLSNFGVLTELLTKTKGSDRYYINDFTERFFKSINLSNVQSKQVKKASNTIYFGSPGTGKSNTVDNITKGYNVRKVTFHPEYDYHSFVGGFKPSMESNNIVYKFVPQVFTNVYVEAWKKPEEHFYLQIEEINRGNCAEIFGDLFQLLDRDADGSSKYDVDATEDLVIYLKDKLGEEHNGIKDGKIKLPSNLSIIATMNTSDQSLFPMDSAFKRRWDWEYIKIDYKCEKSDFIIKLNNGNSYDWLNFLEAVNILIFETTGSPDKQIGNWFINAIDTKKEIDEKTFINKVLFYLWNDVFKDEDESLFTIDGKATIYEDFFTDKNEESKLIVKMIEENLDLENKTIKPEDSQEDGSTE